LPSVSPGDSPSLDLANYPVYHVILIGPVRKVKCFLRDGGIWRGSENAGDTRSGHPSGAFFVRRPWKSCRERPLWRSEGDGNQRCLPDPRNGTEAVPYRSADGTEAVPYRSADGTEAVPYRSAERHRGRSLQFPGENPVFRLGRCLQQRHWKAIVHPRNGGTMRKKRDLHRWGRNLRRSIHQGFRPARRLLVWSKSRPAQALFLNDYSSTTTSRTHIWGHPRIAPLRLVDITVSYRVLPQGRRAVILSQLRV